MSAAREIIPPPGRAPNAERSAGPLASMAVRGGDFIFVSGLTAVDPQSGARAKVAVHDPERARDAQGGRGPRGVSGRFPPDPRHRARSGSRRETWLSLCEI